MDSTKREATEASAPSSGGTAAEVGSPSATDAVWAAMMIPHHRTGIETAELAAGKAVTAGLRDAAAHSKDEQERDLPQLEQIIRAAGKTAMPPEEPIQRMNEHDMKVLQSLSGVDFDRYWITVASGHHMAAIMMTETAIAGSTSGTARALQQQLRDAQLQELSVLNDIEQQLES